MASIPEEQKPRRGQKQKQTERRRLEAALEEGLEETFPASDPVAVAEPRRQTIPDISAKHGSGIENDCDIIGPNLRGRYDVGYACWFPCS